MIFCGFSIVFARQSQSANGRNVENMGMFTILRRVKVGERKRGVEVGQRGCDLALFAIVVRIIFPI